MPVRFCASRPGRIESGGGRRVIHYTYADGPGYIDAYGEYRSRFEKKHAGRLKPVARGNTRFLQALFDDKEQVRSFYGALLAARKRLALERRQSGRT